MVKWLALSLFFLCSCQVYKPSTFDNAHPHTPENFCHSEEGEGVLNRWWETFGDENLTKTVEKALEDNYSVKQAVARLDQANAILRQAQSELYPSLKATALPQYVYTKDFIKESDNRAEKGSALTEFSYEVDIWNRIRYNVKSKCYSVYSSYENVEAAALLIVGKVVDLWFTIQEKIGLIDLIESQIKVSKTLLDLVELRFTIGQSSALDVYQQRLQLADTLSQLVPVRRDVKVSQHALNVLLGLPPQDCLEKQPHYFKQEFPAFPNLGTPGELIKRRPDLRAAYTSLRAADFDVATAVADMYPVMSIPISFEMTTADLSTLFENHIYKIGFKAVEPIFDGYKRRAVVCQKEAVLQERLENFREKFLVAMQDVEDAVVKEKAQLEIIKDIQIQIDLAKKNLEFAKDRYANGLSDYLTVISAIQTLQRLERRIISEKKQLYNNRASLYRALGARCLLPGACCE